MLRRGEEGGGGGIAGGGGEGSTWLSGLNSLKSQKQLLGMVIMPGQCAGRCHFFLCGPGSREGQKLMIFLKENLMRFHLNLQRDPISMTLKSNSRATSRSPRCCLTSMCAATPRAAAGIKSLSDSRVCANDELTVTSRN